MHRHTLAYVSIRQHTSAYVRNLVEEGGDCDIRLEHAAADELGEHDIQSVEHGLTELHHLIA